MGVSLRRIIAQIAVAEIGSAETWLSLTLAFALYYNRSNVSLKRLAKKVRSNQVASTGPLQK